MTFPLEIKLASFAAIATYPPGATFGPRQLVNYEFVWIIEGDVEYQWNQHKIPAPAGTILLCPPPATDFFRWDQRRFTRHAYFHFGVTNTPDGWPPPEEWPVLRLPHEGDLLRPLFSHLLHGGSQLNKEQSLLTAELLLTAFITGDSSASEPPASPFPDAVQNVMDFIHQTLQHNPAASFTLSQLAKKAFVTPEHLCRLFQEYIEFSPMQAVRLLRLEKALQLVARTNYPLKEIAIRCGFAQANHFSRTFSQVYGATPRQIRNAARQGVAMPQSPLTKNKRL
jgi:AraC-like DNA-binding protein